MDVEPAKVCLMAGEAWHSKTLRITPIPGRRRTRGNRRPDPCHPSLTPDLANDPRGLAAPFASSICPKEMGRSGPVEVIEQRSEKKAWEKKIEED